MKKLDIVVPTDFSACSLDGVRKAVELVKETGGRLRLLYVVPDVTLEAVGRDLSSHHVLNGPLLAQVEEKFTELAPLLDGCNFKTAVQVGHASAAIVAYAAKVKADLIMMATHRRRGFKRFLLGSTAEEVVRTATCPVLTVGFDHDDGHVAVATK